MHCDISALDVCLTPSTLQPLEFMHCTKGTLMRKILFTVAAVVAVASLSGCANWDIGKGKGKGKAPPPVVYEEPAPAPVYK